MSKLRTAAQVATMAAVVATLVYWPAGLLLALVLWPFRTPFAAVVTFGGALPWYAGMLAWWLLFFVPAAVYAVVAFPWHHTAGFGSDVER